MCELRGTNKKRCISSCLNPRHRTSKHVTSQEFLLPALCSGDAFGGNRFGPRMEYRIGWQRISKVLLSLPSHISDDDIEVDAERHFEMSNGWAHDKSVTVTTAWRVLRLRMEERLPIWGGSCEYIEQAVADCRQGWSSSLGVGEVLKIPYRKKYHVTNYSQRLRNKQNK
jgi:hypothetical protein